MQIYQAIVLGLVQGFTEFLPISSSGHILIFSKLFNISDSDNLFLSVMLHLGTLIPVVVAFKKEILSAIKSPKTLFKLLLAALPIGIIGVIFGDLLDEYFYGGTFLILGFILTAGLLIVTDVVSKKKRAIYPVTYKNAAAIGLMQTLAVLPGVSRSGTTVSAGVFLGVKEDELASFSFLLSIPAILGAGLIEGIKCIKTPINIGVVPLIFGLIASVVSGFISVNFMAFTIKNKRYKIFALYVLILSLFLVIIGI